MVVVSFWAAAVIIAQVARVVVPSEELLIFQNVLTVGLLGYVLAVLLKYLFRPQMVTLETIAASLCGYLLLGMLWARVYSVAFQLDDRSFSFSGTIEPGSLDLGGEQTDTALYLSFVTLTTLGYGDITPAKTATRMLCTVEAVTGQLYLAVLVARLVGLHIAAGSGASHLSQEGSRKTEESGLGPS